MSKPCFFAYAKTISADQLHRNDQHICFCYINYRIITLGPKFQAEDMLFHFKKYIAHNLWITESQQQFLFKFD